MQKISADCLRVVSIFIVIAAFALAAAAQDLSDGQKNDSTGASAINRAQTGEDYAFDKKNAFSVWGGFAPDTPSVFNGARRSKLGEIGLRYSRRIFTTENLAIKYQIDFIPFAVINYRHQRLLQTTPTSVYDRERETAYAVGLTPVNFQLNFRRKNKIQPFITTEGSFLIFGRKIPDDRSPLRPGEVGRRLNFQLAVGGGVEFLTANARSYTAGFRFNHISNNSTANINPGFDHNLFYFGYTFKKW